MADKAQKPARCITPEEAARRLGLYDNQLCKDPRRQVFEMMRDGRLLGRRIGKFKQVVESSLEQFIQEGVGA